MKVLIVCTAPDGYRRAGLVLKQGVNYADLLTHAQAEELRGDPRTVLVEPDMLPAPMLPAFVGPATSELEHRLAAADQIIAALQAEIAELRANQVAPQSVPAVTVTGSLPADAVAAVAQGLPELADAEEAALPETAAGDASAAPATPPRRKAR